PAVMVLDRTEFLQTDIHELYARVTEKFGRHFVIRPAKQGSSIGVRILRQDDELEDFEAAVNAAFFRELLPLQEWRDRSAYDRQEYVRMLVDLRDGLGLPLDIQLSPERRLTIYEPEHLLEILEEAAADENGPALVTLEAAHTESTVIVEEFIAGREFSCIVLRTEDGGARALPPTEIVKGGEVFDYRAKYLPGLSRKLTPIDLPTERIEAIRRECERLFTELEFEVYARIDGFHTAENQIFLNDPNTTSGMLPSSFFFHQAAEIGLNPSQFLTYILRISLQERAANDTTQEAASSLLSRLEQDLLVRRDTADRLQRIAVILGGDSFERHISVESGRNVYEKLSSSLDFAAFPVFLTRAGGDYVLYQLPINLLLKDNADDIREKVLRFKEHPILDTIRREFAAVTTKYASPGVIFLPRLLSYSDLAREADGVFIALHGRPGEDGQLQVQLEAHRLPYNGSGVRSSSVTIDKYRTGEVLREAGYPTTRQLLLSAEDFRHGEDAFYERVEATMPYPLIAKPVDDGCSSAVQLIKGRNELRAYVRLLFRVTGLDEARARRELRLRMQDEFPHKNAILFEERITAAGADHFLEITGGLLTHPDGEEIRYQMFEPSETLAAGEILSLEEKFLAGEGRNLTPARLAGGGLSYAQVAERVKADLEGMARALDVEGYCRIDAFVRVYGDGRVETIPIEVNSLPGMTPATAIFHQAALAGYSPHDFIAAILRYGFAREKRRAAALPTGETVAATATAPLVVPTTLGPQITEPTSFAPAEEVRPATKHYEP
ncbi:MAG: D-alanine--D-alanine ligase, partial [Saprospiraceae bacterium]